MAVFPDIVSHYGHVLGVYVSCKPGKAHLHPQGSHIRALVLILCAVEKIRFFLLLSRTGRAAGHLQ